MYSCSSERESPGTVAQHFLEALSRRDFEEAAKYSTRETARLLQVMEKAGEVNGVNLEVPSGAIRIISEEVGARKAVVTYREESFPVDQKLTLLKIEVEGDWEWKVNLRKEDIDLPVP